MSSTSTSGILQEAPSYKPGQEPRYDRAYGEEVYGYYRVPYNDVRDAEGGDPPSSRSRSAAWGTSFCLPSAPSTRSRGCIVRTGAVCGVKPKINFRIDPVDLRVEGHTPWESDGVRSLAARAHAASPPPPSRPPVLSYVAP